MQAQRCIEAVPSQLKAAPSGASLEVQAGGDKTCWEWRTDSFLSHPRPTSRLMAPMHAIPASCRFVVKVLCDLVDMLRLRAGIGSAECRRPAWASRTAAARLRQSLKLVAAYMRRVLLALALEIEPELRAGLPQVPEEASSARPKERKAPKSPRHIQPPRFAVLERPTRPAGAEVYAAWAASESDARCFPRPRGQPVSLTPFYQRLDQLAMIAADPMARARRLAFHLARNLEGPMLAPDLHVQIPRRWGLEPSATFDALGQTILSRSRGRPPPLPKRPRYGPSITRF